MNFCLILTEGYAPFLSLANRGQIFSNDENPGPGHYDLRNALLSTVKVRLSYKFTTRKTPTTHSNQNLLPFNMHLDYKRIKEYILLHFLKIEYFQVYAYKKALSLIGSHRYSNI